MGKTCPNDINFLKYSTFSKDLSMSFYGDLFYEFRISFRLILAMAIMISEGSWEFVTEKIIFSLSCLEKISSYISRFECLKMYLKDKVLVDFLAQLENWSWDSVVFARIRRPDTKIPVWERPFGSSKWSYVFKWWWRWWRWKEKREGKSEFYDWVGWRMVSRLLIWILTDSARLG